MQTAKVGLGGQKPKIGINPVDPNQPPKKRGVGTLSEQQKYEKMWTVDDYREVSPGELAGNTFLSVAKPKRDSSVIDFGCGTGRGSFYLNFMGGLKTTMLDFAGNCLDQDVQNAMKNYSERFDFIQHDLTKPSPVSAAYGYCTDVMEHIPEDDVDTVLYNILSSARQVFFRISTELDVMGPRFLKDGEGNPIHLHLTVKDYGWWCQKFIEHGCTILHSENLGNAVDFYVTAWTQKLPDMDVNTTESRVLENIKENAKWGCNSVLPHQVQEDAEIMLLCGGPSLNKYKDEIIQKYEAGTKIVTVNGAYNWCQENGLHKVNQCMLDSRPFNKRFVEPVNPDCFYFIGSGADPSVFEVLPPERTFYWHIYGNKDALDIISEEYPEAISCMGGSTVALRAIILMRILGFKNQTIYGMDSCILDDKHHAYEQKENDHDEAIIVNIETDDGVCRPFRCQPWMALQAFEFIRMMDYASEEFNLTVKGDGLIAYIIETGAKLPDLQEQ